MFALGIGTAAAPKPVPWDALGRIIHVPIRQKDCPVIMYDAMLNTDEWCRWGVATDAKGKLAVIMIVGTFHWRLKRPPRAATKTN